MFIDNEGDTELGAQELKAIADAKSSPPSEPSSRGHDSGLANLHLRDDSSLFVVQTSTAVPNGEGAFASRDIQKGDLILSERPIFCLPANVPDPLWRIYIEAEVRKLSPTDLDGYLSLQNSHNKCSPLPSPLAGIYDTNAFTASASDDEGGICLRASRFNHSCSPNAFYDFNSNTGELQINALRNIPRGEEIFITYVSRRCVYGSPRQLRQAILRSGYHFNCACSVCSLPEAESKMSDARRQRLGELWETIGRIYPTLEEGQCSNVVVKALREACVEGMRLLQEEGCCRLMIRDVEDFMSEAGPIRVSHPVCVPTSC